MQGHGLIIPSFPCFVIHHNGHLYWLIGCEWLNRDISIPIWTHTQSKTSNRAEGIWWITSSNWSLRLKLLVAPDLSHTSSLFFLPAEPLATCLTGMWRTQLALISLTNSFTPQQVGRKLLRDAHNGESLFSLLIRLRDWALVSHNCSRDSARL